MRLSDPGHVGRDAKCIFVFRHGDGARSVRKAWPDTHHPERCVCPRVCTTFGNDGVHMTTKPPPVPPANRSDKGPGSATEAPLSQGRAGSQTKDPDKVGQAGNSKVNTTNQGYQQDR